MGDDIVTLVPVDGVLQIQDQLKDYIDRGNELEDMNLLDFLLDTYKGDMATAADSASRRPLSGRIPYYVGTGHGKKCQIIKGSDYETMPNFAGNWFPRNDVPEKRKLYCASMLALLSPWRDITDVTCPPGLTLQEAFDRMLQTSHPKIIKILDNIQNQHECFDSVKKKREEENQNVVEAGAFVEHAGSHELDEDEDVPKEIPGAIPEPTEAEINANIAREFSADDTLFADVAINIAMDKGIFDDDPIATVWRHIAEQATYEDMVQYSHLAKLMQAVTKGPQNADKCAEIEPRIGNGIISEDSNGFKMREDNGSLGEVEYLSVLNVEQLRAHDIVTNHLKAHLRGFNPRQMLINVMGQGGTGKSTLLNAITTTFEKLEVLHLLAKTAMSGVAASLIGGTTLHWFGALPVREIPQSDVWPNNSSKKTKDRRKANILPPLWLAIDEIGMCTHDLFTLLSQVAGMTRAQDSATDSTAPFGGLNILLMGDFHQFPPVGSSNSVLYCPPQ